MKQPLRKLFSPILKAFESGSDEYVYQPSHRKILIFLSALFFGLASLVLVINRGGDVGYLFPAVVFGLVSFVGLTVGLLGNDRAVAKIWGSR
ncbi:hypothetical protein FT643_04850 [Ketobacter sp. MCCC 1A13808]|uniref:hypothetical protein n=1 Tax=Ketobacter sp. MCCC 1A13808 TaxID=2602738 RepID=UPI000F2BBD1D|nr:hypothetical protein [Ketobacter sp. MCCC 1A13808]MVF11467.1 hypothetical protein [Ketobacter sp. MCCC 1A13808]RLP54581.1 MAG: hypothetical protein D6160_09200 [Ketobacter sp.]